MSLTLLYKDPRVVIPGAGIQLITTGFRVKPGMTIKVRRLLTQYARRRCYRGFPAHPLAFRNIFPATAMVIEFYPY